MLNPEQKKEAVSILLSSVEYKPTPTGLASQPVGEGKYMELVLASKRFGAVSIKPKNYFISWPKLLVGFSAFPIRYYSSTLSALTFLSFLVTGSNHSFDEIDARILALIHENSHLLPVATGEFYDEVSHQFPPDINKSLYMKRIIGLSGCGTVSIESDRLCLSEAFYWFDGTNRISRG